jgi:hypothetical protein
MTKNELRELLLSNGVTYLYIVSVPDWNGGRTIEFDLNQPVLDDFEYIEWEGDASAILRDRNKEFWNEQYPRYEEPRKWKVTIGELMESWCL